ncbi:hypothetical protein E8E13_003822 [Curvularia kusanoi]|uniref:Uncharacterized protein n=1 Tax=Curvularia kusanoi TaxID=90978 RepID=A0A9P4W8W0_CURKU|nr:hypothetical protein E8E13_003822 [Curvularia kusanoi]
MTEPLASPSHFGEVDLASTTQHFPTTLPIRPGKSKSYLGTLLRKRKLRIFICILAFFLTMGGTVVAALFITRSMQRISAGQAALSSTASTTPTSSASNLTAAAPKTGIGVLIAYLFSAFLTWFTTVGYLMLKYYGKPKRTNKIDEWWTTRICLPVQRRIVKSDVWAECYFRVTFALSDQQLITGIAILIAGFKLLGEERITAYHFSVVRDLAFFSSESHLLSLLAIGSDFSSQRLQVRHTSGSKRLPVPTVLILRLFFMIVFLGLLIAATWITAHRLNDDWYGCPMRCVLQQSRGLGGVPLNWAIASTVFLITQYFSIMLQIGERIIGRANSLRARVRSIDRCLTQRAEAHAYVAIVYRLLRSGIGGLRFYYFSEFVMIIEVMAWFIANCVFAAQNRAASHDVFGYSSEGVRERHKEDDLGFGQIVPLLLLVIPFLTFISTYHSQFVASQ